MAKAAAGLDNLGDAIAYVQALEDEAKAREARNGFIQAKDELLYGDGKENAGYASMEGRAAIDGFEDYRRKLGDLKLKYGSSLTPAQGKLFNKAVEPLEIDATRTGLIHKGKALKAFVVEQATNGAANFKTQAVQNYGDPAQWQKYTAAGLAELDNLSEKLGWSGEKRTAERLAFLSDTHRLTALEMSNADPISALEYVTRHRDQFSPVDHLNVLTALAKSIAPVATKDAIEHRRENPVSSTEALVDRIVSAESGGRANAKNPNSTAGGVGQFLDSMARDQKHRPDVTEGKSDGQILALKPSGVGSRMTRRYAEDNARH